MYTHIVYSLVAISVGGFDFPFFICCFIKIWKYQYIAVDYALSNDSWHSVYFYQVHSSYLLQGAVTFQKEECFYLWPYLTLYIYCVYPK